ncbi:MAG: endolytic transglycosylase MltG [Nitrosomonas sp.]|nr:endolytic transglycosylase MltG [Nitrosomonas sp.]MDL1863733.1 endolytic transglycosylase MltG [Betaproteobacteria bacterium PRO5]
MPESTRFLKLTSFVLIVILVGSTLFSVWFYRLATTPLNLPAVPSEFSIEPGSGLRRIAGQLAEAGILSNEWSFILLAHITGYNASLKAGDYQLTEKLSPLDLLKYLTRGKVRQYAITFLEGWTFSQFRKALDEHPALRHDSDKLSDSELLRAIGAKESHAEGLFFPDTYFFTRNSSDLTILKRAYQAMQQHLETVWLARQEFLPLKDQYDGLILASIIEKETGADNERTQIAGVFINRLRHNMKLQTDPTVIYGMGNKFDGNLRKIDLQTDHEYNTYTRFGLPPTPIAMPGLASIRAAFNPAITDELYFVARGDGTSHFSSTLEEHNRAVLKYQKSSIKHSVH